MKLATRLAFLVLAASLAGCAAKKATTAPPPPAASQPAASQPALAWHDAAEFTVEGKGWKDTEGPWERLPARASGVVPETVWKLGKNTAGICVRFVTDAGEIHADWDGGDGMWHMPPSGVAGLDLYERTDKGWQYVATGRPDKEHTVRRVAKAKHPGTKTEYLLFLPLYHGVKELKLGFSEGSHVEGAPARPAGEKPIVFYGTSITQGGCASRSGMSHCAILRRRMDREIVNLGFSGSGKMEPAMSGFIREIDASLFVLDCLPNMTNENVEERIVPFVNALREKHPDTPILLVENCLSTPDSPQNKILRAQYDKLVAAGTKNLHYLRNDSLLATPEEGTVDGVHPTDLGFEHMATVMQPVIEGILRGR